MLWFFLIFSTLAWGIAEIFYKKGNHPHEKYAHLKTTCFVGLFMGVYALVILLSQGLLMGEHAFRNFLLNILRYLPVSACYIISMTCSYFGVRFVEESISDPIENTSGAIVPILCAIFLHEKIEWPAIIVIVIIVIGILGVGFVENTGNTDLKKRFGKKLAIWAFAMPFCYALLDACGTFLDIFYVDDFKSTLLLGVSEDTIEHMANCCYEFTFFFISIGILIFFKIKGVKLFSTADPADEKAVANEGSFLWYEKVYLQKDKILAAIFETMGQATYIFALSEGEGIAAVILGAGTVIISVILSRIILKEKLSWKQYIFIAIILGGIIALSLLGL